MNHLTKVRRPRYVAAALILICATSTAPGQSPIRRPADPQRLNVVDRSRIAREIDDPACNTRWLLLRDEEHPGGPGQLVQLSSNEVQTSNFGRHRSLPPIVPVPAIRAGDSLILEEHSNLVDARLEAIALGPARTGVTFRVRLKLGGRIVRAVASGPGKANLLEGEAQQ